MADIHEKNVVRETTEAQIAVHWGEEELYYPPAKFIEQANLADPDVNKRFSEENFPDCFQEYAEMLTWDKRWDTVLDLSDNSASSTRRNGSAGVAGVSFRLAAVITPSEPVSRSTPRVWAPARSSTLPFGSNW